MKKSIIIGAGGIGSFTAHHLDRLIDLNQIKDMSFDCYDDDKVELKNILYQNFVSSDIGSYKTSALEFRYLNLKFITKRIKLDDLNKYDLVVLCADNNIIRREAYENYVQNKIPFIDSRANGKTIGIFSSDTENYLDTIDESTGSFSCQNPFQIDKKEIEYGNVIVAAALAQCILNYSRYNKLPNDMILNF